MIPESPALDRATTPATLRIESTPIKNIEVKLKNNAFSSENIYYTYVTLTQDPASCHITYPASVSRNGVNYTPSAITVNHGPNAKPEIFINGSSCCRLRLLSATGVSDKVWGEF